MRADDEKSRGGISISFTEKTKDPGSEDKERGQPWGEPAAGDQRHLGGWQRTTGVSLAVYSTIRVVSNRSRGKTLSDVLRLTTLGSLVNAI